MAYYLAEGAIIKGDVTIGEDSGIWYHATVRGDTEKITIGSRTNIQDNAVLHVGAGALVTQNMEIPDGSLAFGNPAKIKRKLTEEEIASNRDNALLYVKEAKDQLMQM